MQSNFEIQRHKAMHNKKATLTSLHFLKLAIGKLNFAIRTRMRENLLNAAGVVSGVANAKVCFVCAPVYSSTAS